MLQFTTNPIPVRADTLPQIAEAINKACQELSDTGLTHYIYMARPVAAALQTPAVVPLTTVLPPAPMEEPERWVKLYNLPYKISNWGRVMSLIGTEKILNDSISKSGGRSVKIYVPGANGKTVRKYISIAKMVAKKFVPNPNGYTKVRHIDGNTMNCKAWNLEWVSKKN